MLMPYGATVDDLYENLAKFEASRVEAFLQYKEQTKQEAFAIAMKDVVPVPVAEQDVCKHCGKNYVPYRKDQVFCDSICRKEFNRKEKLIPCYACGEMFERVGNQIYCSINCRNNNYHLDAMNSNQGHIKKICAYCGEYFNTTRPSQRFCHSSCYREFNKMKIKEAYHENKPDMPKTRACVICSVEFKVKKAFHIYCSKECAHAAKVAARKQNKNV